MDFVKIKCRLNNKIKTVMIVKTWLDCEIVCRQALFDVISTIPSVHVQVHYHGDFSDEFETFLTNLTKNRIGDISSDHAYTIPPVNLMPVKIIGQSMTQRLLRDFS